MKIKKHAKVSYIPKLMTEYMMVWKSYLQKDCFIQLCLFRRIFYWQNAISSISICGIKNV